MLIELAGRPRDAVYHLLTQVVVPRPIAWVLSIGGDGAPNLAPYSFFNAVSAEPPLVAFSVGRSPRPDAPVKDTAANLGTHPEHTIVLPHVGQLDAVERSSDALAPGDSEVDHAGLELVAWDWVTPRVAGARVALGCTLEREVVLAEGGSHLMISRVHVVWVDDAVAGSDAKGRVAVDALALDPLARLGAGSYGALASSLRPAPRPAS
jgi:flavin reductase (DIM6/NTAB) family NADH-FMN oxidoreductase RutF